MIRLSCVEIGNFSCISIIERVCKVHASERMNDCPVVGGRKYDVECGLVRRGPIGSDWVISHTDNKVSLNTARDRRRLVDAVLAACCQSSRRCENC